MSASRRSVAPRRAGRRLAPISSAGRRVAALAAAGVLAVVALAGCRVESAADAAYVGDTRYTVSDVDNTLAGFNAKQKGVTPDEAAGNRNEIVADLVFVDLAKRYAAEHGLGEPTVNYQAMSQQFKLPDSDPLIRLLAERVAYQQLLMNKVAPVDPSDADYRVIFDWLRSQHANDGDDYQQTKALLMLYDVGRAAGVRNALLDEARRANVDVNPQYRGAEILLHVSPLGPNLPDLVSMPLSFGGAQVPVKDLPADIVPSITQ